MTALIVIVPIVTLVLLYAAFFVLLRFSSKRLPPVVTTMQGLRLQRQSYLTSMIFVGLFGSLFPAGLVLVCMATELATGLMIYLVSCTALGACALLAIVIAAHLRTVSINQQAVTPE